MPWVRFDDQFPIHRKVKGLTDAEFRLHTEAIFWCARNLTDGYVARDELRDVSGISKPERHLTALVSRGLWLETDGGWIIHDYLTYQPSRSKVLHTREQRAAAGSKGGVRSGQTRRGDKPPAKQGHRSKHEAKPKQVASGSLEHPAPLLLKKGGGSAPASPGDARSPQPPHRPPTEVGAPHNPDWRNGKAFGVEPDPVDAERAQRGAALARASVPKRARHDPGPSALDRLNALTAELPPLTQPPPDDPDPPLADVVPIRPATLAEVTQPQEPA